MRNPSRSSSALVALAACMLARPGILPARADSLWSDSPKLALVSDRRAVAVGDIVTVMVQENNSTAKDSRTQTSKKSSIDASVAAFLYSPAASGLMTKGGKMPAMNMGAASAANNGGQVKNSDSIVTRFAVRVVDALPNENLVVEGIRRTSFGGEDQTITLRGTLRRSDITPANTVYSYNLADLSLAYSGSGVISDAAKKGWFHRAWDKISPF